MPEKYIGLSSLGLASNEGYLAAAAFAAAAPGVPTTLDRLTAATAPAAHEAAILAAAAGSVRPGLQSSSPYLSAAGHSIPIGAPLPPSVPSWDSHVAVARMHAAAAYHLHPSHGLSGSPVGAAPSMTGVGGAATNPSLATTAEFQFAAAAAAHAAQRRSAAAAVAAASLAASNPYMDHHHHAHHVYGGYHSPSLRRLSPVDTRGIGAMHPADYMQPMTGAGLGHRSVMSDFHGSVAPSTIASTDLPFSIDGSRLTTPRPGLRQGRKRALSSSPFSDSFDINSMIRFSPNSLVSIMNGSRSGSSTSGSYGHLSAGAISPALGVHPSAAAMGSQLHQLQHFMRQGTLPTSPFLPHHGSLMHHQSAGLTASQQSLLLAQQQSQVDHMLGKEHLGGVGTHPVIHPSGLQPIVDQRKTRTVKKEPSYDHKNDSGKDGNTETTNHSQDPMKDEPGDFIETNCHWKECILEFNTQEELVKHINNDHIHANKKSFVCRWKDCTRDEKPFKAQYMLVVHMRRHTGEKPHRCTFEGCSKAYSRLENLKTHLRSHTGEKPYMCEFPGCTKAFSNASDRAKHQNRTHSNEKPYVCKAPGCTKRYTDPSSLRKHVKTVHGAEFYASKKHKGLDNNNQNGNNKDGDNCATDSSPRSDDGSAVKTTGSLSSPSIKSEDTSSPPQQQQHSPSGMEGNMLNGFNANFLDNPISDNNISTTNGVDNIIEESEWELAEADELDIPEAAMAAAVIGGSLSSSSVNFVQDRNSRNRIKNNLQAKSRISSLLPPLPPSYSSIPKRGGNYSSGGNNKNNQQSDVKPLQNAQRKNVEGTFNSGSRQTTNVVGNRRDSSSTISSFYSSMRSDNSPHPFSSQMSSRRNSDFSQVSNTRLSTLNSPYDPISPGSSRKSSNVSNFQGISASMTAHLQRLHRRAIESQQEMNNSTANLVVQTQNMSIENNANTNNTKSTSSSRLPKISSAQGRQTSMSCQTPTPNDVPNREVRRASDPVRPLDRNFGVSQRLSRHHSYNNFSRSNLLPPISKSQNGKTDSRNIHHPNANIVLEELDENEPIESNQNLIIPDDMRQYLDQVAENGDVVEEERPMSEMSIPISSVSQYADMSPKMPNANNQMLSPTYATLQPVKGSKLTAQQLSASVNNNTQFLDNTNYMHQQMAGQSADMHQPIMNRPAMIQSGTPVCSQMQNNMPVAIAQPMQQNMMQYPMNNSNMCYNHNHHGNSCNCNNMTNAGQNWNTCHPNQNRNGGPQNVQHHQNNYNNAMMPQCNGPNNMNSDYQQQQMYTCTNQTNQNMYNNNSSPCNNYNPNQTFHHSCNNCGSGQMNNSNANCQTPVQQASYTNLMPVKQMPPSEKYMPQQYNVTTNYCMTQHNNQFANQCSPGQTGASIAKNVNKHNDFMYNPQTQETVMPQTHQAEIQCHDISQSCRPASNKHENGAQRPAMRPDTYQRTLQYVQQCQQNLPGPEAKTEKAAASNCVKKPVRRPSVSMEMSPGCKEVTSTTDISSYISEIGPATVSNPSMSLSPGAIMNIPEAQSEILVEEQDSRLTTPCIESLKSAAQTPLLPTNNMVINDMSSSLASFADETKYLQMIN